MMIMILLILVNKDKKKKKLFNKNYNIINFWNAFYVKKR